MSIFSWLDANPSAYAVPAVIATGLLLALLWREIRPSAPPATVRHDAVGAALLLLAMLAWRWPPLLTPTALNPDEAQLLAGALTLEHDPCFWRSLDGHTAGPLDFLALLPTHWLGVPQDYFNARLVAVLMEWGALCASFALLRRRHGRVVAAIGLAPLALFFCVVTHTEILHYSTEHLPLLLLAVGAWALHRAAGTGFPRGLWLGAGVVAGLLPWTKMQATPLAAMLGGWGAWLALSATALPLRRRIGLLTALAAAAVMPSLGLGVLIGLGGHWPDFVQSYLTNNLAYANAAEKSLAEGLQILWTQSQITGGIPAFVGFSLGLLLVGSVTAMVHRRWPDEAFWTGLLLTVVAAGSIIAARRGFPHYLLLLFLPLAWWAAAALAGSLAALDRTGARRIWLGLVIALNCGVQLGVRLQYPPPLSVSRLVDAWRYPRDEIGDVLRQLRQPGDMLAVWGWNSHLYVEAGLPQATREAHTERQLRDGPQRDSYYRPRYLADLARTRPAFFVDAVGPGAFYYWNRAQAGHEAFPDLAAYIRTHYVLVADFHESRLYLRSDRAAQRAAIATAFRYAVSRRRPDAEENLPLVEADMLPGLPGNMIEGRPVSMMNSPAAYTWPLAGVERIFYFGYGYDPVACQRPDQGNGTEFTVTLESPGVEPRTLFHRHLDPAHVPADRGLQQACVSLPPLPAGSRLVLRTAPGPFNDNAWDWAYITQIRFQRGPALWPPAPDLPRR